MKILNDLNKVGNQKIVFESNSIRNLVNECNRIFHVIGKMKHVTIRLSIDKSVTPNGQEQKSILSYHRDKVDAELNRVLEGPGLQSQGKIKRITFTGCS